MIFAATKMEEKKIKIFSDVWKGKYLNKIIGTVFSLAVSGMHWRFKRRRNMGECDTIMEKLINYFYSNMVLSFELENSLL